MAYPPVVIVDADDKVIGWSPLTGAWEKQLIHRVVYVIVEDNHGRVLLHRRSANMHLFPGRWDVVGGHVDVTPDYEESAMIELREEGGIEDEPLEEAAYFYAETPYDKVEHPKRFIKIFRLRYDGKLGEADDHEVAAIRWFAKSELKQLQKNHPEQVAAGLDVCLPYILEGYEDNEHQAAGQTHRPVLNLR
jgi:isopentenyldiphosphate isomerase